VTRVAPLPARAGVGLRAPHHAEVLATLPDCGWFEAHSENYFCSGGSRAEPLRQIADRYPLSLHGVGLSLGSTDPLDATHLQSLRRLLQRCEPALLSEHLSWSSAGGRFVNDLLPLPYTEEALQHLCARVTEVQERLGRQILVENVSSYLQFTHSTLSEWEFLAALAAKSGCGILLDVNNVYVNATNHGFDPLQYLQGTPPAAVQEFHLAGHSVAQLGTRHILLDTHSQPVAPEVWRLFAAAVARCGPRPTLIEWDSDIPALQVLLAEAARADAILAGQHAVAA
jgi:uncharacterized protein (UPF0276 family)